MLPKVEVCFATVSTSRSGHRKTLVQTSSGVNWGVLESKFQHSKFGSIILSVGTLGCWWVGSYIPIGIVRGSGRICCPVKNCRYNNLVGILLESKGIHFTSPF